MARALRVLIIEDSESDAILTIRALERAGYAPTWKRVDDPRSMRAALGEDAWDVILSDWSMPGFSALGALDVLKATALDIPCIIVSGAVDENTAVEAMRAGARDYMSKGKLALLAAAVERELEEKKARHARTRAELDLRSSEVRYRAMFENSPLPMWTFDMATLAFVTVNEAAVRHYGYTRDEFAAMTIMDVRPPEDATPLWHHIGNSRDFDATRWRHRKKDGSIIFVEIRAHEFEIEHRRLRLVLVNDITERLRSEEVLLKTEEQLRQAQKMEAVGRLAGGIAHDFNNMLSVILSLSSLILSGMEDGDPLEQDLREIESAGKRAAELTRQLLAFSRQQVLEPQVLDLNEVLVGVDKMLHRILGEDVELVTVLAPALHKVRADPGSIEQIVMNLVVNARDAMPKGGTLTIETANVELDEAYASGHLGTKAGPHVMLAVSDTGEGMDAATQARIFEPFFTTKEKGKGTGLGLSTVLGIVQQNNGNISVYSEPGKGTAFRIYLPRTDEVVTGVRFTGIPAASAYIGSETILLMEDEPQVRSVARSILRRCGYEVVDAADLNGALSICRERKSPIHLLLTDVVLPKTSGADAAKQLLDVRPGMKVLFMSGYAGEAIVHHGILESGMPYLQKPFTPESLSRKVREVLDTR